MNILLQNKSLVTGVRWLYFWRSESPEYLDRITSSERSRVRKSTLVEITLEMRVIDSALMGTEVPPLEKGRNAVDAG